MKNTLSLVTLWALMATALYATQPMRQYLTLKNGRTITLCHDYYRCPSVGTQSPGISIMGYEAITPEGLGVIGNYSNGTVPTQGDIEIPVIMVGFPDLSFDPTTTRAKVDSLFNAPNYQSRDHVDFNAAGSVRDYFIQNSNSMFRPHFTVIDSVIATKSYAYYGKNTSADSNLDQNVSQLTTEALQRACDNGANLSQFAVNNHGVPLVIIYYAGPGAHASYEKGAEDYIWPHFMAAPRTINGVQIRSYLVSNEKLQKYAPAEDYESTGNVVIVGSYLNGCGVLIHEMGHALGLTDEYATRKIANGAVCQTPDFWSVMDYGQYQENGYRPMLLSAYERNILGWLDLQEIPHSGHMTLHPSEAYLIRNPEISSQYYILEPRQEGTWYRSSRFGTGMLVWHIDYQRNTWSSNSPNNDPNRLGIRVVPADSQWQNNSTRKDWADFRNDLYPGDSKDEASQLYTQAEFYGLPLYNIRNNDGVVDFDIAVDGIETTTKRPVIQTRYELNPWIYIQNNKKYFNR